MPPRHIALRPMTSGASCRCLDSSPFWVLCDPFGTSFSCGCVQPPSPHCSFTKASGARPRDGGPGQKVIWPSWQSLVSPAALAKLRPPGPGTAIMPAAAAAPHAPGRRWRQKVMGTTYSRTCRRSPRAWDGGRQRMGWMRHRGMAGIGMHGHRTQAQQHHRGASHRVEVSGHRSFVPLQTATCALWHCPALPCTALALLTTPAPNRFPMAVATTLEPPPYPCLRAQRTPWALQITQSVLCTFCTLHTLWTHLCAFGNGHIALCTLHNPRRMGRTVRMSRRIDSENDVSSSWVNAKMRKFRDNN